MAKDAINQEINAARGKHVEITTFPQTGPYLIDPN
jgi:hypothetical protein